MADDETRAARQKALAEKKRRLEEIKARRRGGGGAGGDGETSVGGGKGGGGASLDEYIDGLLKTSTPGLGLVIPSVDSTAPSSSSVAAAAAAEVGEPPSAAAGETRQNLKKDDSGAGFSLAASAGATAASISASTAAAGADVASSAGGTFQPQSQVETFEIAIQTEEDDFPPPSLVDENEPPSAIDDDDNDNERADGKSPNHDGSNADRDSSERAASSSGLLPAVPELTPEEKNKILATPSFHQFLSTASKRVERLLGASDEGLLYGILSGKGWGGGSIDFTVDYAREGEESDDDGEFDDDEDDVDHARRKRRHRNKSKSSPREAYQTGGFFTAKATYSFPRWTQGRHVTDVEWCPSHKEWVLASYNAVSYPRGSLASGDGEGIKEALSKFTSDPTTRYLSPREPSSSFLGISPGTNQYDDASANNNNANIPNQGLVAIYNLTMPTRPEHIFCSGCPILHSQFHPTEHPKLIVGGAASGQILVWDARVGRYPVQRSSGSSMGGHDCELVGMAVLGADSPDGGVGGGSGGSCTMVTASSDGKVNYWSASNLREPAEHVMVPKANLSCLQVLPGGEGVVCGDERGGVHAIFASSGSSASVAAAGGGGGARKLVKTLHAGRFPGGDGKWSSSTAADGKGDDYDASLEKAADMGHFGMVTAVATRSSAMNVRNSPRLSNKETTSSGLGGGLSRGFLSGVGGLMVTTGVDWSTKIWAPAYSNMPLLSYLSNSYDYMCDAQWSPVHPSIFATASTRQGLNRIQWSGDGRRMAVASGDKLHVLGVGEDVWKSKGDEDGRVMNNLLSRGLIQQEKV
ncbi:hypothetical protein ACHAXS_013336 [Conticribra weissflogii]